MKNIIFCLLCTLLIAACAAPTTTQPPTAIPTRPPTQPQPVITNPPPTAALAPSSPPSTATLPAAPTAPPPVFSISSTAFENQKAIPAKFSCDGDNVSPHLKINGVPKGTVSLALVMDDPDAPSGTFTHWILYNLPPTLGELKENIVKASEVPGLGLQGLNSSSRVGYFGPCPPAGAAHRYYFKLYALDLKADLPAGLNVSRLMETIKGHILAQTEWMGTYQRK